MNKNRFRMFNILLLSLVLVSSSFISAFCADEPVVPAGEAPATEVQEEAPAPKETPSDNSAINQDTSDKEDAAKEQESNKPSQDNNDSEAAPTIAVDKEQVSPSVATSPAKAAATTNEGDKEADADNTEVPPEEPKPKNERITTPGSMAGHTKMHFVAGKAATCTEDGELDHYHCDACGRDFDVYEAEYNNKAVRIDIVIPAGHSWGEDVVVRKPTTACEGLKVRTCKVCQATEEEVIPKLESAEISLDDGFGGGYTVSTDENGAVCLKDFFFSLDPKSPAEETVVLTVNGQQYTLSRDANGNVKGLPEGFEASGRDIKIKELNGDLSINISSHSAISYVSVDPVEEKGIVAGAHSAPRKTSSRRSSRNTTATRTTTNTNTITTTTGANAGYNAATSDGEDVVTADLNAGSDSTDATESSTITAPKVDKYLVAPNESSYKATVILADLALGLSIVLGFLVLWKLGLISFKPKH